MTNDSTYHQLTPGERYQIDALHHTGWSRRGIARLLGRSHSTISRELLRNSRASGYQAEAAIVQTRERRASATKHCKWTAAHWDWVKRGLHWEWSPQSVSCRIRLEKPDQSISHTTIYRQIAWDKAKGGLLYTRLPRYGKRRCTGGKRQSGRTIIPDRVDITERPAVVEKRSRIGDWEGDTIHGKDAYLVSLVERKSRLTLLGRVRDKQADTVSRQMIDLLKRVTAVHPVKTITLDNGGEFATHTKVADALGADIYFAKPYASYQRGTNEHMNGRVRRRWPKKTAFGSLSDDEIIELECMLNLTPLKVLGGLTPIEAFTGQRGALIG